MMNKNVRLVQEAYKNVKTRDMESLLKSFAEDVEWELPEMENVPFSGTWKGRDGVKQFFAKVFELQDIVELEPEDYFTSDHQVVVLGRFTMRVKATDRSFSSKWAHVWTIKDGEVKRFYQYVDTAAVIRAHTATRGASPR